jgi:hypothetical protein
MRVHSALRGAAVAAFAALTVAGCGRPVGSLSGKVTYNGKAIRGGNVTFVSTDGGSSFTGTITADGTYAVPQMAGGDYKVCVETASAKPATTSAPGGVLPAIPKGAKVGPPPGANIPEGYTPSDPGAMSKAAAEKRYTPIPAKYADPKDTDLTYTFKGGDQTFDIDLK